MENMVAFSELLARFAKEGRTFKRGESDGLLAPHVAEAVVGGLRALPGRGIEGLESSDGSPLSRLDELHALALAAGVEVSDDEVEQRTLVFTASDETVDRYGDVILVDGTMDVGGKVKKFGKGWLTDEYRKNPVFMAFHEYDPAFSGNMFSGIPLGQSVDVWTDQKGSRKRLRQAVLMDDGSANPLSPLLLRAYRSKLMRSVSVGFMPVEGKVYSPKDDDERAAWGLGRFGYLFGEQKLWELSAVSIPANPNARLEGAEASEARAISRLADEVAEIGTKDPNAMAFAVQVRSLLPPHRRTSVEVHKEQKPEEPPVETPPAEPDPDPEPESSACPECGAALTDGDGGATQQVETQLLVDAIAVLEAATAQLRDATQTLERLAKAAPASRARDGADAEAESGTDPEDSTDEVAYEAVIEGFERLSAAVTPRKE